MRIVTWTVRLVIFLILLAFAAKNVAPVTLKFYFDKSWQAPLVVVLHRLLAPRHPPRALTSLTTFFPVVAIAGFGAQSHLTLGWLLRKNCL